MTQKEKETFDRLSEFVMENKGSFRDRLNALFIMGNMILNDETKEEEKKLKGEQT